MLIKIPRKEAIAKFPRLPLRYQHSKVEEFEIDYPVIFSCIYFPEPGQKIIGNICKFGNLHISTLTRTADLRFIEILATSKLEFLPGQSYTNQF